MDEELVEVIGAVALIQFNHYNIGVVLRSKDSQIYGVLSVRRLILLIVSCALMLVGLRLLYMQIFVSDVIKGILLMSSAMLIFVGAGLLYSEFVESGSNQDSNE